MLGQQQLQSRPFALDFLCSVYDPFFATAFSEKCLNVK